MFYNLPIYSILQLLFRNYWSFTRFKPRCNIAQYALHVFFAHCNHLQIAFQCLKRFAISYKLLCTAYLQFAHHCNWF
jgi:hypothetical protein